MATNFNIVQEIISVEAAEAPLNLQNMGAIISLGGTNTAINTLSLLTQLSDFTAIKQALTGIASLVWSSTGGGTVTVTTNTPHGYPYPSTGALEIRISGNVPGGYNGDYACTTTSANTFTYSFPTNLGAVTQNGTYSNDNLVELTKELTTFFAQGSNQCVYVLELGPGNIGDTTSGGISILQAWITNNPQTIYAFLLPNEWNGQTAALNFLLNYNSSGALTYFFQTTTTGAYTLYPANTKCLYLHVDSPTATATEFGCAAHFYQFISQQPSSVNRLTPMQYRYVTGVTPWPIQGNQTLLTTLLAANVNLFTLGSEGGISNVTIRNGVMHDANAANYWWAIDAFNIHAHEDLANEVLNGNNNNLNPLVYNQAGINRLLARLKNTYTYLISWGVIYGPPNCSAVAFALYVTDNPTDFTSGIYRGLAATITPIQGFSEIIFNLYVALYPTGQ